MIEIDGGIVRKVIENGKRLDNRKFDEYRKTTIEKNVITSAEGSARVVLGDTEVIAGIKIGVGEPFPDTPDEGVLIVNAEFVPLASPDFEKGPPGEGPIEVARIVDRTIRESKTIDFKKLCLKPKQTGVSSERQSVDEKGKIWMVFIDIDILDHDGNLIDAACLAATAAMLEAKIPDMDADGNPVYDKKGKKPLPLTGKPIATTFVKIDNSIINDPTYAEEAALDARLTIGTVDIDGKTHLSAMQKGGTKGITLDEAESMIDNAVKKGDELRKLLD